MKEVRFFYAPDAESKIELPAEEVTHAVKVLRLQEGDDIFLIDGKGNFFKAQIDTVSNKHCFYHIVEKLVQPKEWSGNIHLGIAPTKHIDRIEWMAEKATEIGFDQLSFLRCTNSERTVIREDRIEKVVLSAVKQSRKSFVPQVNSLITFNEFITSPLPGRKFIAHCYEEISKTDLFSELENMSQDEDITILIGPEGDFSIDEVHAAMANGFQSISLGRSRLRTETAGLYAVMMAHLKKQLI